MFIRAITQFDDFSRDIKTIKSVERNLKIIGKASNKILKEDQNIAEKISQIRNIIDTRCRISHGYEFVSYDILWNIIHNDIPLLKKEVSELLKN
ncbi:HepT-like ribonuclease domain-containing protein [Flavimarina sp. Hel_I_48]|uniref:HepT-like ribonuclease domain-containing protein n=1 Tax=Flavimarina sp. Hel_I_48 TaxID=1392488 RepID=UPI0009DDFF08